MSYDTRHVSPVWSRITDIVVDRGEGAYLYDVQGRRYLDFTCGIAVTNTGHCHPRVVEAIREQAGRIIHAQVNILYHAPLLRLVEALRQVVPSHLDSFFFSNSGAEALEGAVKLARHATGRPNVVVFQGSFHGRTNLTMAMTTSRTVYRQHYQPLAAGVFVAPYPYAYRYGWDAEETSAWCLKELRHLLASQTAPTETAAIVVEPVLGEGGYVVPPASFLRGLREICDEHGILLVADEVQTGFGRTGKFFAVEHYRLRPDVMTMAKGLASGLPLSGVAAPRDLMESWIPGTHGGTYGGNAVACAAAEATVRVLQEEGLVDNAARLGQVLLAGLRDIQARCSLLGDVRGLGLMVGAEFTLPDGAPATALVKQVVGRCLEQGLLLLTCGTYGNVIRWIPPLVVSRDEIESALEIFDAALAASV
ncbi:MAG TPA: aminotransferase class III-fold pyridoxal phosphate-dependent enzyme [Anaerolineae bacterium]|nr:aminotransferase class III-fold pyridoxal phosphate-dependent enzyme [Anaerolineae bacterium]